MKKLRILILMALTVTLLLVSVSVLASADGETVEVQFYDGQTLLGQLECAVGSAPEYGVSGEGFGLVYEDGALKRMEAVSFYEDEQLTLPVTVITEDTDRLYIKKGAVKAFKWAAFSSATPSLQTLVAYSDSDPEIYSVAIDGRVALIEGYSDIRMTVTETGAARKLQRNLTIDCKSRNNRLDMLGEDSSYGLNLGGDASAGYTLTVKNATVYSSSCLARPQAGYTDSYIFENLAVNWSGTQMIDCRSGGSVSFTDCDFNLSSAVKTNLVTCLAGGLGSRRLTVDFTRCNVTVASGVVVNEGLIRLHSGAASSSSAYVTLTDSSFDMGASGKPPVSLVGSGSAEVELKGDNRIAQGAIVSSSCVGTVSVKLGEGLRLREPISNSAFVGVTPVLAAGAVWATSADSEYPYVLTSDYCRVTMIRDGQTEEQIYQRGYTLSLDSTVGYMIEERDGVKLVQRAFAGWYDGNDRITTHKLTEDITLTLRQGEVDGVYAAWAVFNSDESIVVGASFDPEFADLTEIPSAVTTLVPEGGVLRLYDDLTLSSSSPAFNTGTVIDLNSHRLSIVGGALNISGSATLSVKNGTLDASSAPNVLYAAHTGVDGGASFTGVTLITKDGGVPFDFRGGTLELDGCVFDNPKANFLTCSRYKIGFPIKVTLSDCVITCNTLLYAKGHSENATPYVHDVELTATGCTLDTGVLFNVSGNIREDAKFDLSLTDTDLITRNNIVYSSAVDGERTLYLDGVRLSHDPTVSYSGTPVTLSLKPGYKIIAEQSEGYSFVTGIPTEIKWGVTLYVDFIVRIYISGDYIAYVSVDGGQHIAPAELPREGIYYVLELEPTPADRAAESFDLTVGMKDGSVVSSERSIADYLGALLSSEQTDACKALAAATANYLASAYRYSGRQMPASLSDLLGSAEYDKYAPEGDTSAEDQASLDGLDRAISSAQLDLGSRLLFRFNLAKGFSGRLTLGEEEYTVVGGVDTATSLRYISYSMPAYLLYSGNIEIRVEDGASDPIVGSYSLGAYAARMRSKISEELYDMLCDLTCYAACASVYKAEYDEIHDFIPSAEVVNKGGASAVVTYVIDDGNVVTGGYAKEFMEKYDYLRLSFAIPAKNFATLKTYTGSDGKLYYVMRDDGGYEYEVDEEFYAFWQSVMSMNKSEIINHSHTHQYWGLDDEGGVTKYVNSGGTVKTSTNQPVGSTSKEIYAPLQILRELFPEELYPEMANSNSFIIPGISVKTEPFEKDGVIYPTYNDYFTALLKQCIADGTLLGARSTFQKNNTADSASKVMVPAMLASIDGRMSTNAYMILNSNKGQQGIENWTAYIDHAIDQGGWACFCIHEIRPTVSADNPTHFILNEDADALFGYVQDKNVWVATYSEALSYYCQWSTSEVSTSYRDGAVYITLTDGEDNEVYASALTVKVAVPNTWTEAECMGQRLAVYENEDGSHYVLVDTVPDGGELCITKAG